MTPPRWLFWHRRDLRLADNLGLAAAAAATPAVTGVFVLDPALLAAPDLAPARLWFLRESLLELAERWRAAGSRLLLLRGEPALELPRLAEALGAEVVAWNRDVEPYGRERDRQVAAALQAAGRRVLVDWDQLLVAPEALRTGAGDPYRVYGPFLRNWRGQVERKAEAGGSALVGGLEPVAAPSALVDVEQEALPEPRRSLWTQLPLLEDLPEAEAFGPPFAGADLCPCRPGEAVALAQLWAFCDGASAAVAPSAGAGPLGATAGRPPGGLTIPLFGYEPGRNLPAEAGTSALSAALKFGTLSPRQAWAAAQTARATAEQLGRGAEALASIGVWEQELAWREFYQQALFHFPELAEGPYRPQWKHFPWENHQGRYEAWCEGLTGQPFVDAAMRQLNASGWMHNRCRMVVASYLVKDLICDWRWGESAFMARLVDGDLAANNGGWQWSASSGMDPKPLRIFNPATQAAKFDPDATYIRTWLPELRHVATRDLLSGEIAPLERRGYPAPIVNHKVQQARFKALYASLPKA
ncbi:FAD-binding domain-containing protein [Vulcanococcus limneticus]|uniref:FAD-binding domain-containing protein n=1 Tax=Vulcanococcus limneticus TaxID=2170428 RepID=UPI00398C2413